jgi:hypothetical protein
MNSRPSSYRLFAASLALFFALVTSVAAQDSSPQNNPAPAPDKPVNTSTPQNPAPQPAPQDPMPQPASQERTTGEQERATGERVAAGEPGKKGALPAAAPVFWREPSDISSRDLRLGPGGEAMQPDLSRVTFVEEETGGYSVKYRVSDGAGKVWVAKLGKEAQPETAASRLVWAVGYPTEITYLAPCVRIEGAPEPRKEVGRCTGNGFANVRFEARPEGVNRLEEWKWAQNPFAGTREMNGFVVLMAMINNWDLKDSNNKIVHHPERGELHYIVSDLGATFGKTGNFITHNRNEPKDYAKSKFIEKVENGKVVFAYDGKNGGLLESIPVEHAQWIGSLLAKLSDQQIQDAFLAANYPPEEANLLAQSFRARINELTSLGTATVQQQK